jgi:hypothetical protein
MGDRLRRMERPRGIAVRPRWLPVEVGIGIREERFSEWGTVFPDPRLVAAIVDRVTFNAHIIETGTRSYRLATSKNRSRKPAS